MTKMQSIFRRNFTVAAGFAFFIAIGILFGGYFNPGIAIAEKCNKTCATRGLQGRLKYTGPVTGNGNYAYNHSDCICY